MGRIVILDDQPEICNTIESILIAKGHVVRTANTGEEAIDLGYLFEPDLLITDWDLESDYDGYEVAEAVRYAKSNTQAILITGCPEKPKREFPFFAKLPKPFSSVTLSLAVDRALDAGQCPA